MSERKLRVAIIGAGMIAVSAHIPAYRNFPDKFEIVALCDVFEKAAKEISEQNGIPRYFTDAEEMLNEIKPDIVSVCTPNSLHKKFWKMQVSAKEPFPICFMRACHRWNFIRLLPHWMKS